MRGRIACRLVPITVAATALRMLSAYSDHTVSACVQASAASTMVDPHATHDAMSATFRRSNASASMPP